MKDDITKRMWAIFDETGVFLALCRHGFALVIATWSRVGNCKSLFNPFCVLCLTFVLPERNILLLWWKKCWMYLEGILVVVLTLGVGLRQHSTTAHWALVLASSTTRHWLALFTVMPIDVSAIASPGYVHKGLGLEDLEGCERAFSKSNSLAAPLWYASVFHRIQSIAAYFKHNNNMEVFQNLSK